MLADRRLGGFSAGDFRFYGTDALDEHGVHFPLIRLCLFYFLDSRVQNLVFLLKCIQLHLQLIRYQFYCFIQHSSYALLLCFIWRLIYVENTLSDINSILASKRLDNEPLYLTEHAEICGSNKGILHIFYLPVKRLLFLLFEQLLITVTQSLNLLIRLIQCGFQLLVDVLRTSGCTHQHNLLVLTFLQMVLKSFDIFPKSFWVGGQFERGFFEEIHVFG